MILADPQDVAESIAGRLRAFGEALEDGTELDRPVRREWAAVLALAADTLTEGRAFVVAPRLDGKRFAIDLAVALELAAGTPEDRILIAPESTRAGTLERARQLLKLAGLARLDK